MNMGDRSGAIAGASVRVDGELVARDCTVKLPALSAVTAEINAGGPVDLPITGQFESMEASITKKGIDADLGPLTRHRRLNIEIRVAQDALVNGEPVVVPIKAFLGAIPKEVTEVDVEPGEVPEVEVTYTVLRYQLFADNREIYLVDKPNGIYRNNGEDFGSSVEAYL